MSDTRLLEAINAGLEDVVYVLRSEPDVAVEFASTSVHALVSCTRQEHYDDPELSVRIVDARDLDVLLSAATADGCERVDFTVRRSSKGGRTITDGAPTRIGLLLHLSGLNTRHDRADHRPFPGTMGRDP